MNEEERAVMQKHVEYWRELMQRGIVVVYGPVMDPAGGYGVGVVDVDSEQTVLEITKADPASSINRYEIAPMRAIVPERQI